MAGNVQALAKWRHPCTCPLEPGLIKVIKDDFLFNCQKSIHLPVAKVDFINRCLNSAAHPTFCQCQVMCRQLLCLNSRAFTIYAWGVAGCG
jgi:hypothetical protein